MPPLQVPGFYLSFFDIDGLAPWNHEQLIVEDYSEYVTTSPANLLKGAFWERHGRPPWPP